MKDLEISVVVIAFNEERNISSILDSLVGLNYVEFEVLVVDGGSKDKTQEIVKKYAKKDKRIKLVVDDGGSITSSRNLGVKKAKFDYIAFTDADCIVPRDWLRNYVDEFSKYKKKNEKLAGVGGANIPPVDCNKFQKALGIVFDSMLGSLGSIQAKVFDDDKEAWSISCSNSFYLKKSLIDVGLFSEDLGNQGEDWEMGYKMQKKGYKLIGLKSSFVWHNMRSSPLNFWKNMVFYGDGRMRLNKKLLDAIKLKYLLPFPFIIGMASVVLVFLHWIFYIPLLYFPFIFVYSSGLCIKKGKIGLLHLVFMTFLIQHFGYALGMVKGLRWLVK
jgi:glycosyltransferase involved in cell wall biosynthesis